MQGAETNEHIMQGLQLLSLLQLGTGGDRLLKLAICR